MLTLLGKVSLNLRLSENGNVFHLGNTDKAVIHDRDSSHCLLFRTDICIYEYIQQAELQKLHLSDVTYNRENFLEIARQKSHK